MKHEEAPMEPSYIRFSNPQCTQLFIVFTGRAAALMMSPAAFFADTGILDRNVLLFKDAATGYYSGGIDSNVRSLEDLLSWLRGFIAAHSAVSKLYCLGTSMGAFTALMAGHYLGADRVWAFAPPVADYDEGRPNNPTLEWNLPRLLSAHNGKTSFDIYFSEGNTNDAGVARRLDRCPGVTIVPQPGSDHSVVATLSSLGKLKNILPPIETIPTPEIRVPDRQDIVNFVQSMNLRTPLTAQSNLHGMLDSLRIAQLVYFLESRFGIRLRQSDLAQAENFASVEAIASLATRAIRSREHALDGVQAADSLWIDASEIASTGFRSQTFLERIVELAERFPSSAFAIYPKLRAPARRITYGELLRDATRCAHAMARRGVKPAEVVGIVLTEEAEIPSIFLGAMMLGALPSVLAPPSPKVSSDRYTETLLALVEQPHIACIVTSSDLLHMLPGIFNRLSARMPVTTAEEVFAEEPAGDEQALDLTCDPEAPAFLQHSSGTTGLQKGVTVTHGMLDSQMRMLEEAIDYRPQDRIVSWLPLYHDMGLVACMLFPMYTGGRLIQLSTFEWLSNPGFLLDVVEKNRGSLCWLPNFAFIHLANHQRKQPARRDLSSIRMLISCSETVHPQAFALFKEVFGDCNFSPSSLASSYAMAENTFVVTQSTPGNEPMTITVDEAAFRKGTVSPVESGAPGSRDLVSSGRILPQNKVEIVDDEGKVLSEGLVGEIRISGPCVLREYHNNRLATKNALSGSWYFTGDLGFIYHEELFVTGRMKDLLIIAGENIYPQDVEHAAMQTGVIHPGRAAAIGVYDDRTGTERLVILAERKDESNAADEEIVQRIRVSVGETLGLSVSQVIVVNHGWLIKSTSGKTSRPLSYEKAIQEGLL